ncbi:hypothetical protein D3C76_873670 [compost metagenome]
MAKPLKVDEVWLGRITELLNDMEFGSLQIVVHEGQIVQMERTERKRFENKPTGVVKTSSVPRSGPRHLRESNSR